MEDLKKGNRLYFIDKLRSFLVLLVLIHHAMITYGGEGGWYYRDPAAGDSMLFTIFLGLNQAFFMGLLFFVSAYFTPGSLKRNGAVKFLKDRLVRFGIPLLVFVAIINPIMEYLLYVQNKMTFSAFYLNQFNSGQNLYKLLSGNGPLWFIFFLLLFSCFYVLYVKVLKKDGEKESVARAPSNLYLALAIAIMTVLTFVVRIKYPLDKGANFLGIQYSFVMQYLVMLVLGIIAYKRDWLRLISVKQGKIWFSILIISMAYYGALGAVSGAFDGNFANLMGGYHWESFGFTLWESTYCIAISISLIVFLREKMNWQTKFSKIMSKNSFSVYLIHAPVLVAVAALFSLLNIPIMLKFIVVAFLTVILCTMISHFILRRIPGVNRVL